MDDLLSSSGGGELGLRYEVSEKFNTTIALFHLKLDSELVYVGDEGGTEAQPSSRRRGLETSAFWRPHPRLALEASYGITDARLSDGDAFRDKIPGAVRDTLSIGASMVWNEKLSGSLRLRHLGEAPLNEEGTISSASSTLVNAGLVYRSGPLEARLDVFNLLDRDDADISYLYASRLPQEPLGGVEDTHQRAIEPRSARFSLNYRFR